jgi:N-acetylglucosamine malate deacetylase 1
MKLDILVFAAHPDDAELSCSGTIIKHIEAGLKVGVIDLTKGELGTRGTTEIRAKEATEASRIMNLAIRDNLGMADGFFELTEDNKLAVVIEIRKYCPDIILANAVSDRHPDHGRASRLVSEACFLSGLTKVKTVIDGNEQNAWRPKAVYHYIQDRYIKPDFIVDISAQMESRIKAQMAYASQLYNADSKEPETVISSKQFFDSLNARALELGRIIGASYGEGFITERIPGITDLLVLK